MKPIYMDVMMCLASIVTAASPSRETGIHWNDQSRTGSRPLERYEGYQGKISKHGLDCFSAEQLPEKNVFRCLCPGLAASTAFVAAC